ncbi:hypothetical protein KFE80_04235 [bacterium SCSIO 12696]|nr:hypothetical protein KFE80_04235 [bacterium SCSIO 12696]
MEWDELEHAYGQASDIPQLLKELEVYPSCESYGEEPFYTLWSSLCHQGNVYSASYAAVPVIVSLIEKAPEIVDYNYFLLPVCIEIARLKGCGPKIGPCLEFAYTSAIQTMAKLASEIKSPDEKMVSVLAAVTAVHFGNAELAEAILEFTPATVAEFQEWLQEK